MACSCGNNCLGCKKKGGRIKKYNRGGYLQGPSHEQGGIPARLQNGGQVELEGGEYIINAQTVNAVGTEFLDELNSTATTYHQGGFQPGQLGNGSNYRKGGLIRGSKMKKGGRVNRRRYQMGGSMNQCAPGQVYRNGRCVSSGTRSGRTSMRSGYRRGGPVKRLQKGGVIRSNLTAKPGQYVNARTRQPYSGPMHMHNNRPMVGATHTSARHDYLIEVNRNNGNNGSMVRYNHGGRVPITNGNRRTNRKRKYANGGIVTTYVYSQTGKPYNGSVVMHAGQPYSTTSTGTYGGNSKLLKRR